MPDSIPASHVAAWLRTAETRLDSRLEAELLAVHGLSCGSAWLYAHPDQDLAKSERERLDALLARRLRGEPVAYILGEWEFYGRTFRITPAVLIPRPETELLVERALVAELAPDAHVLDVGTGSGCIVLTLAAERPKWRCTGIERCPAAMDVAVENRARMNLDRVELLSGDLLEPVAGRRFDLIVSNPPYVAENDPHLQQGDLRFEPATALVAAEDGLAVIRRLSRQAAEHLSPDGWLMVEHGHDQARAAGRLFREAGFEEIQSHRDLAGIPRVLAGRKPDRS